MKKLSMEQKAKRYEYIEKAFLERIDEEIESNASMYGEESSVIEAVENYMDAVNRRDDIIPKKIFYILDKICDEEFYSYVSLKSCKYDKKTVEEYAEFEKEIGE